MGDVKTFVHSIADQIEKRGTDIEAAGYSVIYLFRDRSGGDSSGAVCGEVFDVCRLAAGNIRNAIDYVEAVYLDITNDDATPIS